jgi:hypothetical protein
MKHECYRVLIQGEKVLEQASRSESVVLEEEVDVNLQ